MKKVLLSIVSVTLATISLNAQNVNIPDANFKASLIGNSVINTNSDSEIQVSEALAYSGSIYCPSLSISDLTGIEAFPSITELHCGSNQLTSLNVSSNLALTTITCYSNQLTSLNLSNNSALTTLTCGLNQITSLDLSNNPVFYYLGCSYNQLSYLNIANGNNTNFVTMDAVSNPGLSCIQVDDVAYCNANWPSGGNFDYDATSSFSVNCPCIVNIPDANFKAYLVGNTNINTNSDTEIQCSEAAAFTSQIWVQGLAISDLTGIEAFTNLTSLNCNTNSLTSIDVSSNTALVILNIAGNSISSLDVSANTNLYDLFCDYNDISSLNVSANLGLGKLNINNNLLTTLDLSNNNQLIRLECESNSLTSLNIKNTNNTNVTAFYVTGNPNLTCIEVDDVTYSTTNWTNIDAGASFSLDCGSSASINENQSIELSIFPNPASDVITVTSDAKIEEVSVFDSYGNLVNTFNSSTFSVNHLSAGIYFLNISTEKGTVQSKFIKN